MTAVTDRQLEAVRDLVRISRQPGAKSANVVAGRMRALGYTNAEISAAADQLVDHTFERKPSTKHRPRR